MNLEQAQTIGALFRELAQVFEQAGVDFGNRPVEMTATQYINEIDQPDAGTELPDNNTNTPEQVFTSGADVAAVFAPAPQGEPVYTMTDAANGYTRAQLLEGGQGWTDELLVSNGLMTVEYPKPPAPPLPAPPAITNPSPQPTLPAPASPSVGAVELDSTGLPWDARIHSGGRTKTAKGEWVKKKNVQPNIVAQVTAELRQNPPGAQQPATHVPLAPPAAVAAPAPAPVPPAPARPGNASAAVADANQRAAAAAAGVTDAASLMKWVSPNGHGPNMAMVGQLLGFTHFGQILEPENAHRVAEAYSHFVALKG